jgi:hypothetical protein
VDEERVKSALEIAMERLSSMPELTPEEIAQQKEEEFRPVGQAIGRRYLTGMIDTREMVAELARHGDESERIVRSACISTLCASIRMEDSRAAGNALTGLSSLAENPDAFREEADSRWNRLWNAYKKREEAAIEEFETEALRTLAAIGISGSAIRPNLGDSESVQAELESLRRSFDRDLETFRSELARKILNNG